MRLSTLLLLLQGRIFIPTVRQLQKDDPNEACIPADADFTMVPRLADLTDHSEWFLGRAERWETSFIKNNGDSNAWQRIILQIWLRELAARRCVWCWHAADIESMALWHIYAHQGVAVRSDIQSIEAAFSKCDIEALCGRVEYVDRIRPHSLFHHEALLWRPYFFKQRCYQHEKEVRFAFADDSGRSGVILPVDAGALIKEVLISPHLVETEAIAVEETIKAMLPDALVETSQERSREAIRSDLGRALDDFFIEKGVVVERDGEIPPMLQSL